MGNLHHLCIRNLVLRFCGFVVSQPLMLIIDYFIGLAGVPMHLVRQPLVGGSPPEYF